MTLTLIYLIIFLCFTVFSYATSGTGADETTKITTENRVKRCSCMWKRAATKEMPVRFKRGCNNCPWDNNDNDNSAGSGLGLNLNGLGAAQAPPAAAAPPIIALPVVDPVTGRIAYLGTGRESSLTSALGKREEPWLPFNSSTEVAQKRIPSAGPVEERQGKEGSKSDALEGGIEKYTAGTNFGDIDETKPVQSLKASLDEGCVTSEDCQEGEECRWSPTVSATRTCQCIPPSQRHNNQCIQPIKNVH